MCFCGSSTLVSSHSGVDMKKQSREEALERSLEFCFELLKEGMADSVYRMSSNRCDFKVVPILCSRSLGKGTDTSQWQGGTLMA